MIHYEILDEPRIAILQPLTELKDKFYLAGGTGLALQLGHRDSADFDFFSEDEFDTATLFQKLEKILMGRKIEKVQEEKNTLSIIVDDDVKISFFYYPYKMLNPLIEEPNLKIASIEDIAVMKASAIVSRATLKDYVDLYFILGKLSFEEIITLAREKLPALDENLIRKSLVFFEDVLEEAIIYKIDNQPSWEEIKDRIKKEVIQNN